jgi:hypothetical protein
MMIGPGAGCCSHLGDKNYNDIISYINRYYLCRENKIVIESIRQKEGEADEN